jgi:hypothetical protein
VSSSMGDAARSPEIQRMSVNSLQDRAGPSRKKEKRRRRSPARSVRLTVLFQEIR